MRSFKALCLASVLALFPSTVIAQDAAPSSAVVDGAVADLAVVDGKVVVTVVEDAALAPADGSVVDAAVDANAVVVAPTSAPTSASAPSSASLASDASVAPVQPASDAGVVVASDAGVAAADGGLKVPAPPVDLDTAADSIAFLVKAAQGGHWSLFLGVLVTLLIFLYRKLTRSVLDASLPWVAVVLGIAGTVGISLSSGLPLVQGVVQGFITGATSVGLWELIFKHVLPRP